MEQLGLNTLGALAMTLVAASLMGPLIGFVWTASISFRRWSVGELFALTALWAAVFVAWTWLSKVVAAIHAFA